MNKAIFTTGSHWKAGDQIRYIKITWDKGQAELHLRAGTPRSLALESDLKNAFSSGGNWHFTPQDDEITTKEYHIKGSAITGIIIETWRVKG